MNDIVQTGGSVATWDPNSGAPMPAYLSNALGQLGTNIPERTTVPSLSYEGKTWSIVVGNEKNKLQSTNADGDTVPVPVMRMIILNFNADRGRSYYPGVYNPAQAAAPTCWSPDGRAPDASVKEKQSTTCKGCPMSVKGSKVQEGREMVACSEHRMLAIAPAFDIGSEPLRLKIAVTSDWDKNLVEHGWYAFRQYLDYINSRGISHTAMVVTKAKFDPNVAYPKLLFALERILTPEEATQATAAANNPKVAELLSEKWTAAGTNGTQSDEKDTRPQPTDPTHIHGAGTDAELWWDGDAWVKPWSAESVAPPPPAAQQIIDQPAKDPRPTDSAHIHGAGTDAELWWNGSAWVAPWDKVESVADAGFAPEPTPAAIPAAPEKSGIEAARDDGWVIHPDNAAYYFKGQEVLTREEVAAKYPGNAASAPAAPVSEPPAAATAAPADGEVPPEVKGLLDKWSS